jgi:predicted RNA binding protein YcfA (HicA-like mRNA interferase family)
MVRQHGSHLILRNQDKIISVPRHSPIVMAILREILLEVKINEKEFLQKP